MMKYCDSGYFVYLIKQLKKNESPGCDGWRLMVEWARHVYARTLLAESTPRYLEKINSGYALVAYVCNRMLM